MSAAESELSLGALVMDGPAALVLSSARWEAVKYLWAPTPPWSE